MAHYKRMFDDKEHLYAFDLDGREVTVTIEKVTAGELQGDKGRKSKKPIVKFVNKEKKLALNKTNGKAIATMYGPDTDDWAGKQITIYPTTTEFGGETVECIRVKPQKPEAPRSKSNGNAKSQPPASKPDLAGQIAAEMARDAAAPAPPKSDEDAAADRDAEGEAKP